MAIARSPSRASQRLSKAENATNWGAIRTMIAMASRALTRMRRKRQGEDAAHGDHVQDAEIDEGIREDEPRSRRDREGREPDLAYPAPESSRALAGLVCKPEG